MFKTILITFSTTAGALAANLSLNSILGLFGLAATSVDALNKLQASYEVIQKMKSRPLRKQKRITKRFVKRSGKHVAFGALTAATVGTVAVVAAMTTIEVADYCEEQEELQADRVTSRMWGRTVVGALLPVGPHPPNGRSVTNTIIAGLGNSTAGMPWIVGSVNWRPQSGTDLSREEHRLQSDCRMAATTARTSAVESSTCNRQ